MIIGAADRHVRNTAAPARTHHNPRLLATAQNGMPLADSLRQEERTVINRLFTGSRCKNLRPIAHPAGAIDRHTHGTIRYGLENLGRDLVMVDWDTGKASMVFPSDIEIFAPVAEAVGA